MQDCGPGAGAAVMRRRSSASFMARTSFHTPRGMLEFQADPSSPTHRPEYEVGKELILYCGTGGRSALAAKALKDMGFVKVAHVAGGFPALQNAGMPID